MDGLIDLTPEEWGEVAAAAAIFLGALVVAWLLQAVVRAVIRWVTRSRSSSPGERLGRALRGPIVMMVLVQASAIAIGTLSFIDHDRPALRRTWLALTLLVLVIAAQRMISALITWYATSPSKRLGARLNIRSLPLVRRAVNLTVLLVGGLVVLDALGLQITPLLAGLGIGGIAVALALQPLLANVFASSYMLSDASVRVGDVVEIAGGPTGTVEDIGWRATRLRNFDNNIVLIPNARLADATLTNYSSADRRADAQLRFSVSAEADLDRVEAVCLEELIALRDEHAAAVREATPTVQFSGFTVVGAAPAVEVVLRIRARTWNDSFTLRHLLVKRVHARLRREGIG